MMCKNENDPCMHQHTRITGNLPYCAQNLFFNFTFNKSSLPTSQSHAENEKLYKN
jgi:hypothetical protein